ncbi:MAG: 4-amino-4-deoxychorismate lyase [Bacteroidetes bacterium CG02_land_8_20_14_3_00_31_25]|nr:MAG: 4-amino-4-deoxychorismate lyase [Bacteroidetes bacterium CG02_land_8_20_14_3_00_31_25]PIY02276.1 MAG: 4-amino-4-deoxychorismate lyase [Bacteroidetes bacterium CG_4_10_14_3_um_filter_31_20]
MSQFVCYNGEFIPADKPIFYGTNRAFRYGDGLFETMRAMGTSTPFLNRHIERLKNSASILQFEIPENYTVLFFQKQITRLLNANKYFNGSKIRLSVFRKDGGNYLPHSNKIDYYIEATPLETNNFSLNAKGLIIVLFNEWKKPVNELSGLKTSNSLLYVKAASYAQSLKIDDCLLLNQFGNIIESSSSNLFVFTNNNLLTPSLTDGCLNGVMRQIIIQLALKEKITVYDDACINENDILNADEVFLTNAINGIRWVVAFKNRRYFCKIAKRLSAALENLSTL